MQKYIFLLTALLGLASPAWADDYQAGYNYGYDNGEATTDNFQFNAGSEAADLDNAIDDEELRQQQQSHISEAPRDIMGILQVNN